MKFLGKDKQVTLLAFFLVYTSSICGQSVRSYKFHFPGNLQTNNVSTTDKSIDIDYSISDLEAVQITNSTGTYYRLSIPGHISSSDPGKPEVPVYSRLITLPQYSQYKIRITNVKSVKIRPSDKKIEGLLFPSQESETKAEQQSKQEFKIDKAAYATKGLIGGDTVTIETLGTARTQKLSNLYISPVKYNPKSNYLEVITSMKIEITFQDSNGAIQAEKSLFSESFNRGILNFNPDEVVPGYSDQPVRMIILTDSSFKKQLKPFIKWKTQKGIRLEVLYKGSAAVGGDFSTIKKALTDIYNSATETNLPPEYLLIIGDVNTIPTYIAGTNGNISDMYYGEFTGNGDYIPEMFIGRLPVSDTLQLKTTISKIIQYEKFLFADTNKFYTKAMVSAGFDDGYANYMNGQIRYAITNYLTPANQIEEYHFNYPQSYTAKDSIINLINKGVSFINYTGHGDATGWLHVNIKSADMPLMNNNSMYPFIISNACRTAQFNLASSFGNSMVLSPYKGSIGFIGCSNDSYWDEDFYWAVGAGPISSTPDYASSGPGAYDHLFHTHGESPSEWYYTMGQINYAGNLSVSSSMSSRKKYYWETYNLIGDPSVIPITGKPGNFSFILPDTIPNGIKSISLTGDPFAYVAISHADTLWDATFTSKSGEAVLNMPGISNDSCLIVITGQNKLPLIKTIYISTIKKEFINLTSHSVNDTQGNNNSLADYGETFFLKLNLSNSGLTDAHDVYAKISSDSPWITINNDSLSVGTLTAGSNITLSDKLSITVSKTAPDLGTATLDLVLKDQQTQKNYKVDICLHSPDPQILNCVMNDKIIGNGDDIAEPGESFQLVFKIMNQGSSDISGQMNLSSSDNDISISTAPVKSGVISSGLVTEIPITVKLSDNVPSGSLISVSALLDCDPYLINKDFSFRVGRVRESFESASFKVFPWINVSSVPWITTPKTSIDGGQSARSGIIGQNGSTSLVIRSVYASEDSIRFFYKVSSENSYDFLSFKLNGEEVFRASGEVPWKRISIAVPSGLNTMEWVYKKDNSVSEGSDCAWIDMIDFAQSTTVKYIERDLKMARIVTPVIGKRYGYETLTARVLNVGKDTINGFNLTYSLENYSNPVTEKFNNQVIPYGDSVTVSFQTKADLTKHGIYKIIVYGSSNNDDYLSNDTLSTNIENMLIVDRVTVYPNPFTDKMTIIINSLTEDKIKILISNLAGMKLYEFEKEISEGFNSITLENLRLLPSTYYLNIAGSVINKTIPVIKIK